METTRPPENRGAGWKGRSQAGKASRWRSAGNFSPAEPGRTVPRQCSPIALGMNEGSGKQPSGAAHSLLPRAAARTAQPALTANAPARPFPAARIRKARVRAELAASGERCALRAGREETRGAATSPNAGGPGRHVGPARAVPARRRPSTAWLAGGPRRGSIPARRGRTTRPRRRREQEAAKHHGGGGGAQ